ncbi:MAG: lysophospholipid acyltransferase family protein [Spirochaetota bacterium]
MKRFLYKYVFAYIGFVFIRLLYCTYRIKIINKDIEDNIIKKGKRPIYVSWHQRFFPGIFFLSGRKPIAIIVSKSKDGDIISKIIQILGWRPVRGSSSKGGLGALREVKRLAKAGYSLGHIVDGPRGPFGEVKPGLLIMAKISGMPVLPVIISAESKWVFNSWDKFNLPKPFSKIIINFGKETFIQRKAGIDDIELCRIRIQEDLNKLYKEIDGYWK